MNGIHDMGGMHGFGRIPRPPDEPVFHAPWERRAFGLALALEALGLWSEDAFRSAIERIPPAEYLRQPYYERWVVAVVDLLQRSGAVTAAELAGGRPVRPAGPTPAAVPPGRVPALVASRAGSRRDVVVAPRFRTGQSVRARNLHPSGHTRLPRYARGRLGTVERDHGVWILPDTNADGRGENPQHVYSVRFAARELWGPAGSARDAVYVDLWEDHLEPA